MKTLLRIQNLLAPLLAALFFVGCAPLWGTHRDTEEVVQDRAPAAIVAPEAPEPTTALNSPAVNRVKPGLRVTRRDFQDDVENEGSLWAGDGQTNFFFSKNKVRGMGEVLSMTIEDPLIRELANELKRALNAAEREVEVELAFQKKIKGSATVAASDGANADKAKAGDRTPAGAGKDEKDLKKEMRPNFDEIDLLDAIGVKTGEVMMLEVVERYPNGNYKLKGTRKINYRGATRSFGLLGVVKGTEITDDDKFASGKLYDYRLEIYR
jgi:flagellar basal body L-ring protein FlgH